MKSTEVDERLSTTTTTVLFQRKQNCFKTLPYYWYHSFDFRSFHICSTCILKMKCLGGGHFVFKFPLNSPGTFLHPKQQEENLQKILLGQFLTSGRRAVNRHICIFLSQNSIDPSFLQFLLTSFPSMLLFLFNGLCLTPQAGTNTCGFVLFSVTSC